MIGHQNRALCQDPKQLDRTSLHQLRRNCQSVLADDEALSRVADRSYSHPLGYEKIVLEHGADGARVRFHLWGKAESRSYSDIHDHYWDFRSLILFGAITFREYEVARQPRGPYSRYRMRPIGNGAHVLCYEGLASLRQMRELCVCEGDQYELGDTVLHSAQCHGPTLTLVLQGPPKEKENTVFKAGGRQGDITRSVIPTLPKDRLQKALQEIISHLPA